MQKLINTAGRGPFGQLRIHIYKRLYYVMTEVGGMREHHKLLAVRMIALIKEVLKGLAPELVAAGKLVQSDDLWFLNWGDL